MRLDTSSVAEFFHRAITRAQKRRNLHLAEETQFYVVNLLAEFQAAEKLFGGESEPVRDQPLALIYAQALDAASDRVRMELLKIIGDRSLYLSGFFPGSFRRKLIDIDYYVAMGEQAYASVSSLSREHARGRVLSGLFEELAEKFTPLVDILSELSESAGLTSNQDLLRLYERWLQTKSERLFKLLQEKGIHPVPCKKDPIH